MGAPRLLWWTPVSTGEEGRAWARCSFEFFLAVSFQPLGEMLHGGANYLPLQSQRRGHTLIPDEWIFARCLTPAVSM